MSQIVLAKFLFQEDWTVLSEALSLNPSFSSEEFSSANDLATYMSSNEGTLVLASIRTKDDLIQLATLVKNIKRVGIHSSFKIAAVNHTHEKAVEKTIAKLGILDILDGKISTKALRFKLDFWIKSLSAQIKRNKKSDSSFGVKSIDSKAEEKKNLQTSPTWTDPLELEDDIWLLRHENDCKRVINRWLVKLTGPSPYIGEWVETAANSNCWRFEVKSEFLLDFTPGNGIWYFQGEQKPEFFWKENQWLITGDCFEMYCDVSNVRFSKFKLHEKNFDFSQNSEFAQKKEQLINDSFNRESVFHHQNGSEKKNYLESELRKFEPLKGKADTDHLDFGPLTGDINEAEKEKPGDFGITLDTHYESQLHGKTKTDSLNKLDEYHPSAYPNVLQLNAKKHQSHKHSFEADPELEQSTQESLVISFLDQNNQVFDCKLDDYFDHQIIFATSHKNIKTNELVNMHLSFLFHGESKEITLEGVVSNQENISDEVVFVEVHIGEKGSLAFEVFMNLYKNRQQSVDYFIKRAKGL